MDFSKVQSIIYTISNNRYVKAVSNGLISTLPITMIGSVLSLLMNIPFEGYQNFIVENGIKDVLSIPVQFTTNILALYVVFLIAYRLAQTFEEDALSAGILSLLSFFIITPIEQAIVGDQTKSFIGFTWLGAKGLFVAIIVGLVSSRIFVFLKQKNLVIKLPDGVPPTISKTFSGLIPAFIILIIFMAVQVIMSNTSYGSLHQVVYSVVQLPLQDIGSSYWAFLVAILMCQVLWFFGIHGTMVVYSVVKPIWLALDLQNLEAFAAGAELPHLTGLQFFNLYNGIGGSGATLGLCILFAFFATSKRYKTLGRMALPANCFCINEPVIFGTPLIMNPKFMVPFIGVPVASITIAYICTAMGIVPPPNGVMLSAGIPPFVSGFMEGSWKIAALQFVLFLMSIAAYYPFFKSADKEALLEEQNGTEEA